MFLGYMISPEGIKPCPDKTKAVLQLSSPRTIKKVHSLNGKLASLNRFLSKSAEKSLSLFKSLKKCIKKSNFHWTSKAEQAFKQLKHHLSELPLLVAPKLKEELIVYLFASHGAISAVLMTERGTVQTPVYFVSRALQGPERNYTLMEKLVLALVFAAKSYKDISKRTLLQSSCVDGSGVGLILTSPGGTKFTYALRLQFTASNNEAEYEALIAGLWIAVQMGVRNVNASVDSKLVANQMLGTYVAKEENMVKYLKKAKSLISGFANFSISQVPRSKNKKVDALSKIASTSFAYLPKQVLVEVLKEKPIQDEEVATLVEEEGPTWMTPIIKYLKDGTLPNDRKEASKLQAIIPTEIGIPTYRTAIVYAVHNDEELRINLDLLEERRERAEIHEAKAKLKMTNYYKARVCGVTLRPRDLVYHSNEASHAMDRGKLGPKWEGPYKVMEVLED
ncbi:reverse transcriptase domain-containing protein, partial [Tanacetum coccineum]